MRKNFTHTHTKRDEKPSLMKREILFASYPRHPPIPVDSLKKVFPLIFLFSSRMEDAAKFERIINIKYALNEENTSISY